MRKGKTLTTEIAILSLLGIKPMYCLEMVAEIKRMSGNLVDIPAPTLYSALDKLSKKKFINSYWQEAEIGGRRHVYNLTKKGEEFYNENKVEINYNELRQETLAASKRLKKATSSQEDAFNLPLSNNPTKKDFVLRANTQTEPQEKIVTAVVDNGKIKTINEQPLRPEPMEQLQSTRTEIETPKEIKKSKRTIPTTPYVSLSDPIPDSPKAKQMTIDLTGTLGSVQLRPFVKLNSVQAGSDFVLINKLRFFNSFIVTALFYGLFFILDMFSLIPAVFYTMALIIIFVVLAITLCCYMILPRTKFLLSQKKMITRRVVISSISLFFTIIMIIVDTSGFWPTGLILSFYPLVDLLFINILKKGKMFKC